MVILSPYWRSLETSVERQSCSQPVSLCKSVSLYLWSLSLWRHCDAWSSHSPASQPSSSPAIHSSTPLMDLKDWTVHDHPGVWMYCCLCAPKQRRSFDARKMWSKSSLLTIRDPCNQVYWWLWELWHDTEHSSVFQVYGRPLYYNHLLKNVLLDVFLPPWLVLVCHGPCN